MKSVKKKTSPYWDFFVGLIGYKKTVTLCDLLCNVMIFGHGTAVAYLSRQILNCLDTGIQGQVMSDVSGYLWMIALVSVLRVGAIMACATLDSMRGYYYQNRTRLGLFRRLFQRPDMTAVAGSSGKIFEALDDDAPAAAFPAEVLMEVMGYFVCTLATIWILISINWQVTLLVFLPLSGAIYGVQRLSDTMKERRKVNREAHDEVSSFVGDVADSILSIKATGAEGSILKAFDQKNTMRRHAVLKDAAFVNQVNALLTMTINIGTAIMMCTFASMMTGGNFRAGDFSIFVSSLFTLTDCVNRFVELTGDYRRGEVSHERIIRVAEGIAGEALPTDTGLTLIKKDEYFPRKKERVALQSFEVSGLSYARSDEGDGLKDISLRVRPGELIVVAGGVGSGKSTLLGALAGSLSKDAGEILWNGQKDFAPIPPSVAYAPERARFFSTDIEDNLRMGQEIPKEKLHNAMNRAALQQDLTTRLGNRGVTLSGGQRQRLCWARMYAHDAELNIIDDNLSALDETTQAQVLENLIGHLKKNQRAAIVATNNPLFLDAADSVIVMGNK